MGSTVWGRGARLLLPGIFSIIAAAPLRAETQTVTLPQVIATALQNNGDLKALRAEQPVHDAGRIRAGLLPDATLDFEARSGALTGSGDDNSLSLGVSQEFPLGGKRDKRLQIAEREREIYRWQLADRERLLRDEAKSAFYAALLAGRKIELADRAIELNRQLLAVAGERLAAGDIPELELNLVKVELARSEGVRLDAVKAGYQSRARLQSCMGLPAGEPSALDGSLQTEITVTKSLPELKQLAREKRPDLQGLAAEKERGEAGLLLARAEEVPDLTVGLFLAHERKTDATGTGDEKVRDTLLGIRLSLPIPGLARNQAAVQEAGAKRNSSEHRLLTAVMNIERDVETAYAGLLNSEKVLSLYTTSIIPQLEENLDLTREAYRLGEVGILAGIAEQKKFFDINDGYLTALHDRLAARVKLETAVATELSGGTQ